MAQGPSEEALQTMREMEGKDAEALSESKAIQEAIDAKVKADRERYNDPKAPRLKHPLEAAGRDIFDGVRAGPFGKNPQSKVLISQKFPTPYECSFQRLVNFRDYDDLLKHVKDRLWDGQEAEFEFVLRHARSHLGSGIIKLPESPPRQAIWAERIQHGIDERMSDMRAVPVKPIPAHLAGDTVAEPELTMPPPQPPVPQPQAQAQSPYAAWFAQMGLPPPPVSQAPVPSPYAAPPPWMMPPVVAPMGAPPPPPPPLPPMPGDNRYQDLAFEQLQKQLQERLHRGDASPMDIQPLMDLLKQQREEAARAQEAERERAQRALDERDAWYKQQMEMMLRNQQMQQQMAPPPAPQPVQPQTGPLGEKRLTPEEKATREKMLRRMSASDRIELATDDPSLWMNFPKLMQESLTEIRTAPQPQPQATRQMLSGHGMMGSPLGGQFGFQPMQPMVPPLPALPPQPPQGPTLPVPTNNVADVINEHINKSKEIEKALQRVIPGYKAPLPEALQPLVKLDASGGEEEEEAPAGQKNVGGIDIRSNPDGTTNWLETAAANGPMIGTLLEQVMGAATLMGKSKLEEKEKALELRRQELLLAEQEVQLQLRKQQLKTIAEQRAAQATQQRPQGQPPQGPQPFVPPVPPYGPPSAPLPPAPAMVAPPQTVTQPVFHPVPMPVVLPAQMPMPSFLPQELPAMLPEPGPPAYVGPREEPVNLPDLGMPAIGTPIDFRL